MAVTLIISMVMGPTLSGIKTATFLDAQFALAATQAEQAKEADVTQGLREIDKVEKFNPHQNPVEAARALCDSEAYWNELESWLANSPIYSGDSAGPIWPPAANSLPMSTTW